jgi:RecB family exonuclease
MTLFSYSKISAFEQCKYKYKLKYIDKIKVEIEQTIEAFMGNLVHKALEKLYTEIIIGKICTKNELINFYNGLWIKQFNCNILIVKTENSAEHYRKLGEYFINKYYDKNYPFDEFEIIGLETQDKLILKNQDQYHIRIDKLARKNDVFYVCDYKTNNKMKTQDEADNDEQLAMYALWVFSKFKNAKTFVLVWDMLAFDEKVLSKRTPKQLKELEKDIIKKIAFINNCTEFSPNLTKLCDYCEYQKQCKFYSI